MAVRTKADAPPTRMMKRRRTRTSTSGGGSLHATAKPREQTAACDRKTRGKILSGPLGNCQVQNAKPLGMTIFFPLHLQLGVGKQQ